MSGTSAEAGPTPRPSRWGGRLLRAVVLVGAFLWIRAFFAGPSPLGSGESFGSPERLSGVVHVHTNLSDGRGTPAEVVEAARRAGVDFLVVTDHNRVDPERFDTGAAGGPVVIVGSEISTDAGHILAIGIRPPTFEFSGTLREVLDDVRHLGGCAFVAHPTSPRGETRFTREDAAGDWGVEVVNGDTAWREASVFSLALAAWTYPVNPSFALSRTLGDFRTERALWDRVLARRFAPGIGGTDAHGRIPISRTRSLGIPSYEALFNLARTVVHLREPRPTAPAAARAAIVRALCAGESVVAIPSLADAKGFSFVAQAPDGALFGPGQVLPFVPGLRLRVGGPMPSGTRLDLLVSGGATLSSESSMDIPVDRPGVYRVEAYLPGVATPWVLSNPISILSPEMEAARIAAATSAAAPLLEGRTQIARFETPSAFAPEHDPASAIDEPIVDASAGRNGGAAARLSFHLSSGPRPPVWTALVDRTPRDLSGHDGVSFWMKADGEYRIWFQIRDRNPASDDEGTEAWFASIRTTTEWTHFNVPFADLRSINRKTDGSFDPAKIAHMVFVIDHGAMRFGSAGRIWIDDITAY